MILHLAARLANRRRAVALFAVFALGLSTVGLLYWRSEIVSPSAHYDYVLALLSLREADAQTDAELLANRLQLTRNYDALSADLARAQNLAAQLEEPPPFFATEDAAVLSEAARELNAMLVEKASKLEDFKRANAVLRNSLAYFPVAGDELRASASSAAVVGASEHYMRELLGYLQSPDSGRRAATERAAESLRAHKNQPRVATLLRHGDLLLQSHERVEVVVDEVMTLGSGQHIEAVSGAYAQGIDRAQRQAAVFRRVFYGLAFVLVGSLVYLMSTLAIARRRLVEAHDELQERYQSQRRVEERLRLHATAFDNAHEGMTLTDVDGVILEVNPAFTRITGYERSEVIGRNPRVLKSGRHGPEFYKAMWKSIREEGNWRGEIWNRGKFGDVFPEILSISAVRDDSGEIRNYVAVFADISRLKEQENQLAQMAYFDALTGLPNRVLLADRMAVSAAQAKRVGTQMAVCYLDLDGFKAVNDTWGHEVGDRLLIEMAGRLKGVLRAGDTVARLGGDEFVLLLVGLKDLDACERAVERLLAVVGQPLQATPEPVSLSASVGVAVFPFDNVDGETLIRHADQAMYRAKQTGKNCYLVFDPIQDHHTRSRFDRLSQVEEALRENQFVLHFQPVADIRRGKVEVCEALIRWQHPQRGLLSPDEFLPLISDTVLEVAVGEWVIEAALRQVQSWRQQGCELAVSVNLTGRHLQRPDFVQRLSELLARHPGQRGRLQIEVLETAAIDDLAKVSQVIEQCRSIDVPFAIDDFGTGYSSLTYLKRLPVNTIKIDRSFVGDMLGDANNLVIVQGILGLARAFGRRVVAEGVECIEQGRLLMQVGCDLVQGFVVARPMPGEEISKWKESWRPAPAWREISGLRWEVEDSAILVTEVQLRNWLERFFHSVREGLPVLDDSLGDRQGLSRWLYGSEAERYQSRPEFLALRTHMEALQKLVSSVDLDLRDGRHQRAKEQVEQVRVVQQQVFASLASLQQEVARRI